MLNLLPWRAHFFHETLGLDDVAVVAKFLAGRDSLQDGEYIREFEERFKATLDSSGFVFSFGAGRMALYATLDALDIGPGDEVILPAFTCSVVVCALMYRGIRPVYADVEGETYCWNVDVDHVRSLLSPRTKAIIAQHNFGVPCDVEGLRGLAERHGVALIEDCAIAMGSTYKGRPVGTFGHAAFFSTDRTKLISTLYGGVALTGEKGIAARLAAIYRRSPFLPKQVLLNVAAQVVAAYTLASPLTYQFGKYVLGAAHKLKVSFDFVDEMKSFQVPPNYPCRLSNLQAALGLCQIRKWSQIMEKRRAAVQGYVRALKRSGVELPWAYLEQLTLRFSLLLKDREAFARKYRSRFDVGNWFASPALGYRGDLRRIHYAEGSCPMAEFVQGHIVNFPTCSRSAQVGAWLEEVVASLRPEEIVTLKEIPTRV